MLNGQRGRVVIWRHALKKAMLPVVTVIGIEFAFLNGGLVVTETVFNLPGVVRGEATLSCLGLGVPGHRGGLLIADRGVQRRHDRR